MITRRQFIRGTLAATAAAAATAAYTRFGEPYWIELVSLPLLVRHLPTPLHGATLIQISDLHVGNRYSWRALFDDFRSVQSLTPDFVAYTGDFVSYESADQLSALTELLQQAPLGRLGTLAILGNHDYGHGWRQPEVADAISHLLGMAGIKPLRNSAHTLNGLTFIGLDDYWGTNFRPEAVAAELATARPAIALCHNPDVADLPVWAGYEGWILAGHTHGGQVKPPFLPPPLLPVENRRYVAGIYDVGEGRTLYINRGTGNLSPIRFNVRPEITRFTLTPA